MSDHRRDLLSLPKTDLHVHLEGSIRPATVVELSERHGTPLPRGLRDGRWSFDDFDDFIDNYMVMLQCLVTADDFRRIAYEFCEDEASQGTRYAEVTFSVALHGPRLGSWDQPVEWVLEGLADGEADFGLRSQLVLDIVRNLPVGLADPTVNTALRHRDAGVVALGLGGDEARFPPELFSSSFSRALDQGLRSVPHAGEAAGPVSIRGALGDLGADRLGHGFRALEDDDLLASVREREIPLEVCPTSNVFTGIVPSLAEHPFPQLLEAGLVVTLNSDDPAMFHSPLLDEYAAARKVFGLSDETLAAIARAGVDASFMPETDKVVLRAEIAAWLEGHE